MYTKINIQNMKDSFIYSSGEDIIIARIKGTTSLFISSEG